MCRWTGHPEGRTRKRENGQPNTMMLSSSGIPGFHLDSSSERDDGCQMGGNPDPSDPFNPYASAFSSSSDLLTSQVFFDRFGTATTGKEHRWALYSSMAAPLSIRTVRGRRLPFLTCAFVHPAVRRWWQTLIPITRAAHVVAGALAPATTALRELVLAGGGHAEMLLSTERMLWARTFGEAFVTEDEVVVMLVPQGWWAWFASLILIFGGSAAIFWPMAICPPAYCYYATRDAVTCG